MIRRTLTILDIILFSINLILYQYTNSLWYLSFTILWGIDGISTLLQDESYYQKYFEDLFKK